MGRISTRLFHLQRNHLQQIRSNLSMKSWSCQFIQKVLNITHRQWLYRNARIHIRLVENMTQLDHNKVKNRVLDLLGTDPEDLLPQHQSLLHQDIFQLGKGPTTDRQYWVAQMESAIAASTCLKRKRTTSTSSSSVHKKSRS